MRNQRFENKKSQKSFLGNDEDKTGRKLKTSAVRVEKNWKNKLMQDDDSIDEDFFHYDDSDDGDE
jgi:hypothetical protein